MSQEVKIGVQPQTDQAVSQIKKVEDATDALGRPACSQPGIGPIWVD